MQGPGRGGGFRAVSNYGPTSHRRSGMVTWHLERSKDAPEASLYGVLVMLTSDEIIVRPRRSQGRLTAAPAPGPIGDSTESMP